MNEKVCRKVRMTERWLSALAPEEGREKVEWSDAATTGLRLIIASNGKMHWLFRYSRAKRKCSMALGPYPAISLADARKLVLEAQAKVSRGEDPAAEVETKKNDLTLAQFVESHFLPHQKSARKCWQGDVYCMNRRILPELGRKPLREITRHDVVRLRNNVKEATSEPTANRHLACLGRCLSLANQWGFTDANVAKGVEKYREVAKREYFLSGEQTRALDAALAELASTELAVPASAVRAILWTGCRRGEVLQLRHEDLRLDDEVPTAFLRQTKSGRSRALPLNSMAVSVLREAMERRLEGNPHVFPSEVSASGHVRDLRLAWREAKEAVGLPEELHLHDLRHSYASGLVSSGASLYVVQKLLGHAAPSMTQRYSHLADGTLLQASEAAVARAAQGGGN